MDGNKDAADSLALLLELRGHPVAIAHSVAGAMQVRDPSPRLVILEPRLPDGDGWKLASQLCAVRNSQRPYLLVVTSCSSKKSRRQSETVGACLHLLKPAEPVYLLSIVDSLMKGTFAANEFRDDT